MLNRQASQSQSTQALFQMQQKRYGHRHMSSTSWLMNPLIISSSLSRPPMLPKGLRSSTAEDRFCFALRSNHDDKSITVNVVVTVQHPNVSGVLANLGLDRDFGIFCSKTLLLEIVSSYLDPSKLFFFLIIFSKAGHVIFFFLFL